MTGDGLVDIVRVRNGEVCYWPNLGYGRFGAKVTLESSPRFAGLEDFDARRIRFGDVDGSGTSDIFYLGTTGVDALLQPVGQRAVGAGTPITSLPPMDSAGQVGIVDLLGTGTASLVWSSPLPRDAQRPIMYVDLMGGVKPHLMKSIVNNLGATILMTLRAVDEVLPGGQGGGDAVAHAPVVPGARRRADRPPRRDLEQPPDDDVHVPSRVLRRRRARVPGVRAGRADRRRSVHARHADTTEFQPPTRTVSWFHTGAWLEKETLEAALALEYYPPGPRTRPARRRCCCRTPS